MTCFVQAVQENSMYALNKLQECLKDSFGLRVSENQGVDPWGRLALC